MSVSLMTEVWKLDLPLNEQSVLLIMADHAWDDGTHVFPSNGLIAWKLGISVDTVRRIRRKLEARKLLILESAEIGLSWKYRIEVSAGIQKKPFVSKRNTPPANCTPLKIEDNPLQPERIPPATKTEPPAQLCYPNHHITINEPPVEPSLVKSKLHEIRARWIQEFEKVFWPYVRHLKKKSRVEDEKALQELLDAGVTSEAIISLAGLVFQKVKQHGFKGPQVFFSKHGVSIAGFSKHFDKIQFEMSGGGSGKIESQQEFDEDEAEKKKYGSNF